MINIVKNIYHELLKINLFIINLKGKVTKKYHGSKKEKSS